MNSPNPINILLIEDNSDETSLISKIIKNNECNINFNIVKDGMEAIDYLNKEGKYNTCVTPSLILLDLNLPKKSGREVLKELKQDEILKCVPIIVLTDSDNKKDIIESYDHHANAYIIKPADFDMFEKYMLIFKNFWFNSVKLPK